ncbi:MAG: alanine racemase [Patescibacteria group bacterium]
MKDVRTWIEIDAGALRNNAEQFLKLIPAGTRLMAVIKSNAYGHGLVPVAKILASGFQHPVSSIQFGVDSVVEALRLRREGIKNPILVLGYTLPSRIAQAAGQDIILTISSFDALRACAAAHARPAFHLKIDTGMYRQGFMPDEIPRLIAALRRGELAPAGVYTHFASAKDPADMAYTLFQFKQFQKIASDLRQSGFRNLICHAASSGGALLFPESHLDMVRVGMGLYGYLPSAEMKNEKRKMKNVRHREYGNTGIGSLIQGSDPCIVRPVMMWKTIISEVKSVPKGSPVGYDGIERVKRNTKIAVLPVGYWHGYDRGLSRIGEALARGRRAKVLGRVSMDMTVVDVTDIPRVRAGDEAVLVGEQGKECVSAEDMAEILDTTHYEVLTRINPLIRRILV